MNSLRNLFLAVLALGGTSALRAVTIIYPVEAIAELWNLPADEFRQRFSGINATGLGPADEGWYVRYRHENLTYLFGPLADREEAKRKKWDLETVRDAAIRNRESLASSQVDYVRFTYSGVYGRGGSGTNLPGDGDGAEGSGKGGKGGKEGKAAGANGEGGSGAGEGQGGGKDGKGRGAEGMNGNGAGSGRQGDGRDGPDGSNLGSGNGADGQGGQGGPGGSSGGTGGMAGSSSRGSSGAGQGGNSGQSGSSSQMGGQSGGQQGGGASSGAMGGGAGQGGGPGTPGGGGSSGGGSNPLALIGLLVRKILGL